MMRNRWGKKQSDPIDEGASVITDEPEGISADSDGADLGSDELQDGFSDEDGELEELVEDEGDFMDNNAARELDDAEHDEEQIRALQQEARDNYDKYVRAVAELENFKKRATKDRSDLIKYAGEFLARDILDVVDNLEWALAQSYPGANEELIKGVQMTLDLFLGVLERHSIKRELSLGEMFDPAKHEAMASVPTNEKPAGTVLQEYKKAYFFKDKLIRPAQVVVAASPAGTETAEGDN